MSANTNDLIDSECPNKPKKNEQIHVVPLTKALNESPPKGPFEKSEKSI